jgi:N-methylhydantoinase B
LDRDPAIVSREIVQGLVTREGAREYGVVILADGTVAAAETETLRARLRKDRGATLPLFNYGASIAELRKASLAETGLPAPKQPIWQTPEPLAAE